MSTDHEFSGYRIEDEGLDDVLAGSVLGWSKSVADPVAWPDELLPQTFTRPENQGRMNSCVGNAVTTVAEEAWYCTTGERLQFSRMFAYLKAQEKNGYRRDQGATIAGAVKMATQDGFCLESVHPYPRRYDRDIPPGAVEDAATRKLATAVWLDSHADVLKFLRLRAGSVLVGGPWRESLRSGESVIETYEGRSSGGHAWALGGWSRRKDSAGRNYLIGINSHRNWDRAERDQFAEIAPSAVDAMGDDRRLLMVGLSHFPDARPDGVDWSQGVFG